MGVPHERGLLSSAISFAAVAAIGLSAGLVASHLRRGAGHVALESRDREEVTGGIRRSSSSTGPVRLVDEEAEVETDSLKPRYDPVLLRTLGVSHAQIFESEERNPKWGPGMESGAGSLLMSDLASMFPELRDLRMECRSRSCFLTWHSLDG
jgi:hypothetical protein